MAWWRGVYGCVSVGFSYWNWTRSCWIWHFGKNGLVERGCCCCAAAGLGLLVSEPARVRLGGLFLLELVRFGLETASESSRARFGRFPLLELV